MEKYTSYYSGFESENEADAWGEQRGSFMMDNMTSKNSEWVVNIRTQPNSLTGLWTCTVTVEKI